VIIVFVVLFVITAGRYAEFMPPDSGQPQDAQDEEEEPMINKAEAESGDANKGAQNGMNATPPADGGVDGAAADAANAEGGQREPPG